MSSPEKQKANRANAQASTGPRTAKGKARAAQNARRHGLSLSVISDPTLSKQVESLARKIAGTSTDNESHQLARRIAEAQVDLIRIRQARHDLLARHFGDPNYVNFEVARYNVKLVIKFAQRFGVDVPVPQWLESQFRSPPQGPYKIAAILSDFAKKLALMDRYERRALSRRKFAIREFDSVRRRSADG